MVANDHYRSALLQHFRVPSDHTLGRGCQFRINIHRVLHQYHYDHVVQSQLLPNLQHQSRKA
jgi:hypothetical protein